MVSSFVRSFSDLCWLRVTSTGSRGQLSEIHLSNIYADVFFDACVHACVCKFNCKCVGDIVKVIEDGIVRYEMTSLSVKMCSHANYVSQHR